MGRGGDERCEVGDGCCRVGAWCWRICVLKV